MTNTNDVRAFEIAEVDQIDETECRVIGLTLKTLKVGDTVCVYNDEATSIFYSAEFDVSRIRVFGRELPQIDRGFYVEIFVATDMGDVLKDVKYLCLK